MFAMFDPFDVKDDANVAKPINKLEAEFTRWGGVWQVTVITCSYYLFFFCCNFTT